MAKVDINIIKEWFRNLKKPNQEQFWSWLDSFRHKDDKIPMDDVENLNTTLQKKADLINGVVPENQLPFTINTNEIISIGEITTTSNAVNIAVHSSGENKVRIGQILTRTFPSNLPFTAVTTGNKFLRVVARNETGIFFLKQSADSDEPQEPSLDPGELHIRLILVTPEGSFVDPAILSGFKEKVEDNWKSVYTNKLGNFLIEYNDKRQCFQLDTATPSGTDRAISYISFAEETNRDVTFILRNNTLRKVTLVNSITDGLSKGFTADNTPYVINSKASVFVKYNKAKDSIEVLKVGNTDVQSIYTDTTLEGLGIASSLLKLSASKNAEIAGKVGKTTDSLSAPTGAVYYVYLANSDNTIFMRMNLTNYMSNYATTSTLSNKIDKVPGAGYRLAQINPDGSLSAASISTAIPNLIYGESLAGNLVKYATSPLAKVDTRGSGMPTLSEMNITYAGEKIVEFPNLGIITWQMGTSWYYFNLTELT